MDENDTATVENSEKWYNCNVCEYKVKKEITLKKHINTNPSRKETTDGLAASYFCDECEYSCHSKKSLKKHKAQNHEDLSHQCNTCDQKFKYKKDLDSHIKEIHCISEKENDKTVCTCTDTTVCDKCLHEDGWVY